MADQVAASCVYGYDSYISSHTFENFYPVDFYNYVKTGGKSLLSRETTELDSKDCSAQLENMSDDERVEIPGFGASSGLGQSARPSRDKLSPEKGGEVVIRIVRDIDDFIHKGPHFETFSPSMYKMAVKRVSKNLIDKRSNKTHAGGKVANDWFNFDTEHPLAHSHVQRLRSKFPVLQFVGMQMPKHPGEEPTDKQSPEYNT